MSNLSDLLPAGAGAKSASFTASGTLSSGQTVALQSDGTVIAISETSASIGTEALFDTGSNRNYYPAAVCYHPVQQKIVIFYSDDDNSDYGKAVVATVSGTSLSFGTVYIFSSDVLGKELSAVYDSNIDRIVIFYRQGTGSEYTEAKVVTVSGTSLSFSGASGVGGVQGWGNFSSAFDSSNNKIVLAFKNESNSNYGTGVVCTASTSSVSAGTSTVFQSNSVGTMQAVYDSNAQKVVVAYNQASTGAKGVVGTVSGTSISFGTPATISTSGNDSYNVAAAYDSDNNKVVVAYRTALSANDGNANVGTVSGTDITFGSAVQYLATSADHTAIVYDTAAKKIVIAFCDDNTNGELVEGTVSGDTISFTSPAEFVSYGISDMDRAVAYDTNAERSVFAFIRDSNIDNYAFAYQASATNSADFVGITDQAIANAATGSVVVEGGVTEKVSGLTTGSTYYVQNDGSLSTTSSSVTAGKALSATKLLLKG